VDGVVSVVPPEETEKLIRAAHAAGVRRIWMQPGAESASAVALARSLGMAVVAGECIMLYPG
jgi:predicted CoA-binding protein